MFSEEIYNHVKKHNGCNFGLQKISEATSIHDLIRLMKSPKGIEFIMQEDFIPLHILEKYELDLEKENIFFKGSHTVVNPRFLVLLGGQVSVEINNYEVCSVYAKRGILMITSMDYAIVMVELKDSELIQESFDQSKIKVFKR